MNASRYVCNGSPITYHSLTLGSVSDGDDDAYAARDAALIAAAEPGDDVIIEPPFSVNVTLDGIDADKLDGLNLVDGCAIPIIAEYEWKPKLFFEGVGRREVALKCHGVDPYFSATFYKAQGRTMSRALADLSAVIMPLTFAAVFVFLSRVKFGKHAKILPLLPGATWDHLAKLRPCDDCDRAMTSSCTWVPLSAAPYLMLTTRALAALQSPRPLPPLLLLAARPRSDLGPLGTLIAPRLRRFRLPRSLASASVSSSTRERRRALVSKILHPFAAAHRSTPHTPVCLALSASLLRELILWLQTCGAWTPFPLLHRALRQM